jgi:hypothetical protein
VGSAQFRQRPLQRPLVFALPQILRGRVVAVHGVIGAITGAEVGGQVVHRAIRLDEAVAEELTINTVLLDPVRLGDGLPGRAV